MTLWFSMVKHSWFVVVESSCLLLLSLVGLLLLSLVGLLLFVELAPKRGEELDKAFADIESLLIF